MVRVSDLVDQIGHNGPRAILYCSACGQEASANAGDYWNLPNNYEFECCGFPMVKVVKSTHYSHVDAEHV
jgi:hypothetical protein